MDEFHNMDINSALNIVQFVEIYEKIWYNKVSETNTFWTADKWPESGQETKDIYSTLFFEYEISCKMTACHILCYTYRN